MHKSYTWSSINGELKRQETFPSEGPSITQGILRSLHDYYINRRFLDRSSIKFILVELWTVFAAECLLKDKDKFCRRGKIIGRASKQSATADLDFNLWNRRICMQMHRQPILWSYQTDLRCLLYAFDKLNKYTYIFCWQFIFYRYKMLFKIENICTVCQDIVDKKRTFIWF